MYQWYGLHLVRPDGTDDHVIAPEFLDPGKDPNLEGAYNPDWSPDGTRILFLDAVHPGWSIMVADADGSNVHEVVPCDDGCQVLTAPAWSPDGRSIAYARFEGEWPPELYTSRYSIEVMDLETGVQRTVVSFDADARRARDHVRQPTLVAGREVTGHRGPPARRRPDDPHGERDRGRGRPGPRGRHAAVPHRLEHVGRLPGLEPHPGPDRVLDLELGRSTRSRTSPPTCTRSTRMARTSRS